MTAEEIAVRVAAEEAAKTAQMLVIAVGLALLAVSCCALALLLSFFVW